MPLRTTENAGGGDKAVTPSVTEEILDGDKVVATTTTRGEAIPAGEKARSPARKVPGLYFIGEVMDVTGWLGGYNFQWAWSSAWACAQDLIAAKSS